MNNVNTVFKAGEEQITIEGCGQATIAAAIAFGRQHKIPMILQGFDIQNATQGNLPLEGFYHIPSTVETKNTYHKAR